MFDVAFAQLTLPYEYLPVVCSSAAASAAFCAGASIDMECPAIDIAPRASPAARKGTLKSMNPAMVAALHFTQPPRASLASVPPPTATPVCGHYSRGLPISWRKHRRE